MDLSLVIPVYNEEESLPHLIPEIHEALSGTGLTYEVFLIDDGSRDRSWEIMQEYAARDPSLVVARFRRNFGQTAAMQAGFDAARGAVVVTLDADLQNDPHDIPAMIAKLHEGYDLVAGWRADRKDRFINRRLPSMIANWLISRTTNVRLHDYGCTTKAIRREVVKEIKLYGEMHRFIPAIASFVGADVYEMKVNHRARQFGSSKYGIGRTLRVVLDLFTVLFLKAYLVRPMQVFGLWGLLTGGVGFLLLVYLSFMRIVFHHELADRPVLLLGIMLVLVGFQLLALGLVADVVGRTYHEAQNKPPYYVRTWVRGDGVTASSGSTSTSSPSSSAPAAGDDATPPA